jgi:hypothetical protein
MAKPCLSEQVVLPTLAEATTPILMPFRMFKNHLNEGTFVYF